MKIKVHTKYTCHCPLDQRECEKLTNTSHLSTLDWLCRSFILDKDFVFNNISSTKSRRLIRSVEHWAKKKKLKTEDRECVLGRYFHAVIYTCEHDSSKNLDMQDNNSTATVSNIMNLKLFGKGCDYNKSNERWSRPCSIVLLTTPKHIVLRLVHNIGISNHENGRLSKLAWN